MKTQAKPIGNPADTSPATVAEACHFYHKPQEHEPWCQVSPEWIALEAVFEVAECAHLPIRG